MVSELNGLGVCTGGWLMSSQLRSVFCATRQEDQVLVLGVRSKQSEHIFLEIIRDLRPLGLSYDR